MGKDQESRSPRNVDRKLVVGLGNPGLKYQGTRHNIGFEVVAKLAKDWRAGSFKNKFQGEIVDVRIGEEQVTLLRPSTFMNRSGTSVRAAVDFYQLAPPSILVVCDDFALELSRLRFRPKGSSGGQKGLADIIRCLETEELPRLRVGIGSPPENWDVAEYVLSKFSRGEQVEVDRTIEIAAMAVADWVCDGTAYCMNKYNGK